MITKIFRLNPKKGIQTVLLSLCACMMTSCSVEDTEEQRGPAGD